MKEIILSAIADAYLAGVRAGEVGIITPTVGEHEYALPETNKLIAALAAELGGKLVELSAGSWRDGAWNNPGVEHHPENGAAVRSLAGQWLRG